MKPSLLHRVLIVGAVTCASGPASPKTVDGGSAITAYRLETQAGMVLTRPPFSLVFTAAKNDTLLPLGSLVYVGAQSQAALRPTGTDPKIKFSLLKVTTETALRLDAELARKVNVKGLGGSELDDFDLSQLKGQDFGSGEIGLAESVMQDAWTRTVGVARKSGVQGVLDESPLVDEKPFQIDLDKSQVLTINKPDRDAILNVDALPARINISWKTSGRENEAFDISIWKKDSKAEVVAQVKQAWYFAYLNEPGIFYIQIASTDRRFVSAVRKLEIVPTAGQDTPKVTSHVHAEPVIRQVIALSYPPPSQRLLVARSPHRLHFAWAQPMGLASSQYTLVISHAASGREILRRMVRSLHADLELEAGTYLWHIETESLVPGSGKPITLVSPVRQFSLEVPTNGVTPALLAELLSSPGNVEAEINTWQ